MRKSFYKSMVSVFALLGTLNSAHAMEEEEWDNPFIPIEVVFHEQPPGRAVITPLTPEQIEWCVTPFTEDFQKHPNVAPTPIENDAAFATIHTHYNIFELLDLSTLKALRLTSRGLYHQNIRASEQYLKQWTLEHPTSFLFVLLQMSPTECIATQRVFNAKLQEGELENSETGIAHPRKREFDAFMSSNPRLLRFFCKLYINFDPLWDYRLDALAKSTTQGLPLLEAAITQIENYTHFDPAEFETLAENSENHHCLKVNLRARILANYNRYTYTYNYNDEIYDFVEEYLRTTYKNKYKRNMAEAPYWGFYLPPHSSAFNTQDSLFAVAKDLSPPLIKAQHFFIEFAPRYHGFLKRGLVRLEEFYERHGNRAGYLKDLSEFRKYIIDNNLKDDALFLAEKYDELWESTTALEILEAFDDPDDDITAAEILEKLKNVDDPNVAHIEVRDEIEFLQSKIGFIFSIPRMDLLEKAEKLIGLTEKFIQAFQQLPKPEGNTVHTNPSEDEESISSESSTEDSSSDDSSSSSESMDSDELFTNQVTYQKILLEIYKGNLKTASEMLKDFNLSGDDIDDALLLTALQAQIAHPNIKELSFVFKTKLFFNFKKGMERVIRKHSKMTTYEKENLAVFISKFKPLFSFLRKNVDFKEDNFPELLNKLEELYKIS